MHDQCIIYFTLGLYYTCALAITILMYHLILEDTSLIPRLSPWGEPGNKAKKTLHLFKTLSPMQWHVPFKVAPQLHYLVL